MLLMLNICNKQRSLNNHPMPRYRKRSYYFYLEMYIIRMVRIVCAAALLCLLCDASLYNDEKIEGFLHMSHIFYYSQNSPPAMSVTFLFIQLLRILFTPLFIVFFVWQGYWSWKLLSIVLIGMVRNTVNNNLNNTVTMILTMNNITILSIVNIIVKKTINSVFLHLNFK